MASTNSSGRRFVVGVTGASGAIYSLRLLEVLLASGAMVHLSISPAGRDVIEHELGLAIDLEAFDPAALLPDLKSLPSESKLAVLGGYRGMLASDPREAIERLEYHHHRDFISPIASGSFLTDGMVICPASGGTMSAVAHGTSQNLICRAADVHLKERRKLVLVPRETPLSLVHIENMRLCTLAGAVVLPAMPGFYHNVTSIGDLIDFVVGRICDQLGVPQGLMQRWGVPEPWDAAQQNE
ncbi:MAG: UbiX family flavin prenyltransferase [Planctomycetia bacterium]|nr:UbiX family flavin prenyltransferase [Planctomycetia bacterium]